MSKRPRRYGRTPSKRFRISDALLYGLTRGLTRDRYEPTHRDPAPKRSETHDSGDTLDLDNAKCPICVLVRVARKLCERIRGRGRCVSSSAKTAQGDGGNDRNIGRTGAELRSHDPKL